MKPEEECKLCVDTLIEACNQFGSDQPEFCELKEQYLTTDMSQDAVIEKLTILFTPEQKQSTLDALLLKEETPSDVTVHVQPAVEIHVNPVVEEYPQGGEGGFPENAVE